MKPSILIFLFLSLLSFVQCNRVNSTSSDTSIDKPTKDYAEPPHIDLINARWVVRELNGKAIKPQSDVYIRFVDKDNAEGFLGCNKFRGTYVSEGADLKIGPLMSTKMACEDLAVESQFSEVLEKATSYTTDDKYMYLKNETGVLAKLEAIYL